MSNYIIKIGIGQLELKDGDWRNNLSAVTSVYSELAGKGCDITIFPELWPSAMQLDNVREQAEINAREIYPQLQQLTLEKKILSHWGSMLRYDDTCVYNQAHIFDADGNEVLQYRKIHLFGLMGENKFIDPGNLLPVIDTAYGRIATAICYDLRFPELFRYYALSGADIILVPAEWPKPRLMHWQRMIQARAIENQVFIVACNRVGKSNNYDFFGHSMVVDPWGEIIYDGPERPDSACVEIDLSKVEEARKKLNSISDINFDLYHRILNIDAK